MDDNAFEPSQLLEKHAIEVMMREVESIDLKNRFVTVSPLFRPGRSAVQAIRLSLRFFAGTLLSP